MHILELWQYPIKGFGGSQTKSARLSTDGYFPDDRHFAISSGGEKVANAKSGAWFPKAHFLQLMSHETLAKYNCQYQSDRPKSLLELFYKGKLCLSVDPHSENGRRRFEDFIANTFGNHLRGQPRLMMRKSQAYSDQATALISIASSASIANFANATGTKPDSRRFRINMIIHADKAFDEFEMIGQTFQCGDVLFKVQEPIGRCAAINVDPETSQRSDHNYVQCMKREFGHSNLGVFAKVIKGGTIKIGNRLHLI